MDLWFGNQIACIITEVFTGISAVTENSYIKNEKKTVLNIFFQTTIFILISLKIFINLVCEICLGMDGFFTNNAKNTTKGVSSYDSRDKCFFVYSCYYNVVYQCSSTSKIYKQHISNLSYS